MSLPSLREMLSVLIAARSVSSAQPELDSSNREVIDLLAGWLDGLGFAVEILPLDDQPHKANLIATLGKGDAGLVLSGHTDTVPCNPELWSHDPFVLHEENNRWYGLGSCDMKGFFPLALQAAENLRAEQLRQPLILVATADEESSMAGARALVAAGRPRARFALIGEPTGLRPIHAHKGILMEGIRVTGQAGHSSNPALGNSALEGMQRVMGELLAWRNELQQHHHDARFAIPVPTLNLGYIHGGDNPNRICGRCELHIDIRPLPGMDLDELRTTLEQRLHHTLAGSGLQLEVFRLFHGTPPMHTPATSTMVQTAVALSGHPAETAAYCTEGPYLNSLGMDTVILGPGHIAQAHQPDEYLPLEHLAPMQKILQGLIDRFCLNPPAA